MKKILSCMLLTFTIGALAQQVVLTTRNGSLTKDWIKVYEEGHIGYLDETGQERIPPVYDEIGTFGEYCNDMALFKKDGLYGLIDTDGNEMVKAQYEMIGKPDDYGQGLILIKKDGLYGFINCYDEVIAEPVYTAIEVKNNKPKLN